MPETVGGAVYTLDLDNNQFLAKTRQSEQQFVASQGRMTAATATQAQKQAAFLSTLDSSVYVHGTAVKATEKEIAKAATTTSKLSNEQRVLNGALRTSASQLAQEIPFARGLSSAFGAAAVATGPLAIAVLGSALAYNVLDAAVQHFTGNNIVDYITGAAHAHELAAQAAKDQGIAEEKLATLAQIGVTGTLAGTIELIREQQRLTAAQDENASSLARINRERLDIQNKPITLAGSFAGELNQQENDVNDLLAAKVKVAEDNLQNLLDKGKISIDQFRIAAQNPLFGDHFASELHDINEALGIVAGSISATAEVLRNARSDFEKGLQLATGELDRPNPVAEGLKVQLLLLEQMRRSAAETYGSQSDQVKALDAQIASLNSTIADTQAPSEIAKQAVIAWGAAAVEAAGSNQAALADANREVALLGDSIANLPTEATIKLSLLDPEHIRELLTAMAAGLSFDVAIRLVSGTPEQVNNQLAQTWAGATPGSASSNAVQGIVANQAAANFQKFMEEVNRQIKTAAGNAGSFEKEGAAAKAAAGATDYLTQVLQAASDGIISLAEATALNLSDEQVIALENEVARQKEADAAFRQRIELEKLAQAFPGLTSSQVEFRLGLKAISDELIKSGRTAEQFQLDEWLRPAFDNVKSMIDEIFNKPTREGIQLDLQLKQLERQKLLIERRGGDTKGIDKQIDALQNEIQLRQIDNDITKDQIALKDKTLQTDSDVQTAAAFLSTALEGLSTKIESNEGMYGALFDAGLKAASALNAVGAAGGSGFTNAEKTWIEGVWRSTHEGPDPFPGFASGTMAVQGTGLAMIHQNEAVMPPDVGSMFRAIYSSWKRERGYEISPRVIDGSSGGSNVQVGISLYGITDWSEIKKRVDRSLSDAERRVRYGGSTTTSSATR